LSTDRLERGSATATLGHGGGVVFTPGPLPIELGATFTRAEALAAGMSPSRLRAGDLDSPFYGVRSTRSRTPEFAGPLAGDRSERERVRRLAEAFSRVQGAGTFFAGRTAAVLLGASLPHGTDLTVGVLAPGRAPRGRGVRGVKVSPHLVSLVSLDGLVLSSPASTWAMLGRELTLRELVIVGDAFVRIPRDAHGIPQPHRQLTSIPQFLRAIEAGPRAGIGLLREAARLIRVGSSSPLETEFRLDVQAAGLPEPDLDVEIRDRSGRLVGITELVFSAFRVVAEVEGDHHRTDRRQWDRDIEKYNAYTALGWEVVRVTSRHVRGGNGVARLREVLLRRGWRAGTG
jgi:hypothetical protein